MPSSLPRRFGRYVLIDRIAAGGMGEVYAAVSGRLFGFGKLCAVKRILPGLGSREEFAARFRDEGRLVISMSHPNVVNVYEIGQVGAEFFMAMELVQGKDLGQLLTRCWRQRTRLPVAAALYVVRELLAALEYCHRHTDESGVGLGLVHRDVSPANVLVSFDGHVKLADFGLALSTIKLVKTQPQIVLGKPGYMAPERLVGGPVDLRADIFCVGVLLFELLTCERFAATRRPAEFLATLGQRARTRPSRLRSDVPAAVDELYARAIAPDPEARFADASSFYDAVQEALVAVNPLFGARRLAAEVMGRYFHPQQERRRWQALVQSADRRAGGDQLGSWPEVSTTAAEDPFDAATEPLARERGAEVIELREASAARQTVSGAFCRASSDLRTMGRELVAELGERERRPVLARRRTSTQRGRWSARRERSRSQVARAPRWRSRSRSLTNH